MTESIATLYFTKEKLDAIRGKDNRVLLGVTGGIASGKSTAARMLEEMGVLMIDFDLLSRRVVEPGKPAWSAIVASFGEQVLLPDGTLDRKKLSEIVFRDQGKRKKLEEFTHPRIYEEFTRLVKEYASQDPNAIIQAVIPLLIEENLQYLFHKLLLVYVPVEIQVKRLMERDGISREMAQSILAAQFPIEEKKTCVDFVVDNSGSLEETKRQVEAVWQKLKDFQKGKRTG